MKTAALWFIVGLICVIKGGDWFVDGATGIARRLCIPDLIIGATIVSIGTTLPEVMVSATSALGGHGEIAYGNALGSIICNTALIAALTAAVRPPAVDRRSLVMPVVFFFAAAAFYAANAWLFHGFSRVSGLVLFSIFVLYIFLYIKRAGKLPAMQEAAGQWEEGQLPKPVNLWSLLQGILLLIIGAMLITVGANLLVDNGTLLARGLGVPESVIALTFVALGTSLPELVTAVTSLVKGYASLSLGNVIGANLFNLVLVNGISSLLAPFSLPDGKTIAGFNSSLIVDIPLAFFVMALLTLPAILRGKLARWQGIILLIIYAGFCVYQFLP